jgi:uncharacterized protein (TIGR02596 family)
MTLLELLVVMVIFTMVLSLVAGSYRSFASNVQMANSIQLVSSVLDTARQLATSRNEYVQIRFFAPQEAQNPRAGQFVAVAMYRADSPLYGSSEDYDEWSIPEVTGSVPRFRQEGKTLFLPNEYIIANNNTYSPLTERLAQDSYRKGELRLSDGQMYDWVGFYFKPDGSIDIPGGQDLCLTFCAWTKYRSNDEKPPANYAVLTLDRINGRFQVVRPN